MHRVIEDVIAAAPKICGPSPMVQMLDLTGGFVGHVRCRVCEVWTPKLQFLRSNPPMKTTFVMIAVALALGVRSHTGATVTSFNPPAAQQANPSSPSSPTQ